jgi:hypothetical protein
MPWEFSKETRRYRETSSGRFIGGKQMTALRDTFLDRTKAKAAGLATDLAEGTLSQNGWERAMRELVRAVHVDLAVLGRGGRAQMTPADWGRVGQTVRAQYGFLSAFSDQTSALSEAQVAARSALYVESGSASYERAHAAAFDITLPAYPGDGATTCGTNCRCSWEIVETDMGVECTWIANDDPATCNDCAVNGSLYNPLILAAPVGEAVAA